MTGQLVSGRVLATEIIFDGSNFKSITYKGIAPTQYQLREKLLIATVNSSASTLLLPFSKPQLVKRISFKWKISGKLKLKTAAIEASKQGDDSYFRVGLMVSGKASSIPFFAPSWIKLTRQYLKHPSDGMQVYFVNAQHVPGTTWFSPYSSSIKNFSVASVGTGSDYQKVTINLKQAVSTVGLWLVSDGDDTKSSFKVWVKDMVIE